MRGREGSSKYADAKVFANTINCTQQVDGWEAGLPPCVSFSFVKI